MLCQSNSYSFQSNSSAYGSIFDYADHAGRKGKTQQGTGQVPCGTSTKDSAEVALFHGTKVGAYRCSS